MAKILDLNPYEINVQMFVEEGNYTVVESAQGIGGNESFGYFASPVHKGDFVKLTSTAKVVAKAGSADTIIGQVIDNPQWFGDRPNESKTSGNYNRRSCTVQLWGDYVKAIQLAEDNTAISVGDSIAYEGNNVFDKAGSSGNTIALTSASANSGDKITVLFGYRGL